MDPRRHVIRTQSHSVSACSVLAGPPLNRSMPTRHASLLLAAGLTVALAACGGGGGGGSAGTSASSGDNGSGSSSGGSGSSGSGGSSTGSGSGSGSGSSGGSGSTGGSGGSGSGSGSGSGGGSGGGGSGSTPQASNCTVTPTSVTCPPWTWEGGSNTLDAPGVYGTQGTSAANNVPGARQQAVSWTDPSGNLWLFGGLGQDDSVADAAGLLNDLWRYDPTSNQWTWVSGSNTTNPMGVYGQLGTPAASNVPTPRYQAAAWTDASGNLWLFGGLAQNDYSVLAPGDKILNDLWEYNPTTNQWTWMSGSNTYNTEGVYGTLGTPAGSNVPPPRLGASTWIDAAGNLWLFGGTGYDPTVYQNLGQYNDLWKFNPTTREWTWIGGQSPSTDPTLNDFFAGQDYHGVYGTQGTPADTNFPGSREFAGAWVDASGNFWMFGGDGYDKSGNYGLLNDLWEYNPTAGEWTWISGSSTVDPLALYGTQGVPAAGNAPGPRTDASIWMDKSGNVWLFGGGGLDGGGGKGALSDLWEYSPTTNQWTWVSGPDTAANSGNYGSLGVAATSNNPGGRNGAVSWTDAAGNHWLFGGYGFDDGNPSELVHQQYLNDLWKF